MPPTNTEIADTYLAAYMSKDPGKALLAPDVSLEYPLSPRKIVGRLNVTEYMLSVMPGFDAVEIERHLVDGEYVATLWKAHTVWGTMPACSIFRISAGLIAEVRSFFDPRPILQREQLIPHSEDMELGDQGQSGG
ncbi:MAG: nuclear transport factor 2 family protein [Acidobacteriia bacterium]|nr:nuclear transport factor 2 family protein [Terriglobia bacterium]